MSAIEALEIPVIALVNGYCLGGGNELALCCDWIIAADHALFGQPEVTLGVVPGFGGTQRLSRKIGTARALEIILSGQPIDARQALDWGLVNHVFSADELQREGEKMAQTIAARGPLAVRLAKQAVRHGQTMALADACFMESNLFALTFASKDQQEGMAAFVEKRSAQFSGD